MKINRRHFLGKGLHTGLLLGLCNHPGISYALSPTTGKRRHPVSIFAFDPGIDANRFAADCKRWGIERAILHPGFFKDDAMHKALNKYGIDLWLNFPVFHNPGFLATHPDYYSITNRGRKAIHDWCHFVCPNRPDYIWSEIETAANLAGTLRPTTMSLDFIRFFVFWEQVDIHGNPDSIEDGCYCPACLQAFATASNITPPPTEAAAFIRKHAKPQWGLWKSQHITETAQRYIAALRSASPASAIWIKTVPWKQKDLDGAILSSAGQNIKALGKLVDGIAPMAFTHILRQTPDWKKSLLYEVTSSTGKPVMSYVQVEQVIRNKKIPLPQFTNELESALTGNNAGVVVFHYEQLLRSPEKAAIIKTCLQKS